MAAAALTFGCHLPVFGPIATRGNVLAFARTMEALGYQSLWASDHVVLPYTIKSKYPYNATGEFPLPPSAAFLEPLTTLALVAGVTERARLGTTILVLPHRHPVLAAKTIATLDHLAEGRVILGVGVGWMREEIEILGGNYDRRGAWSDEAIRIMRTCWGEERARHAGEFFFFGEGRGGGRGGAFRFMGRWGAEERPRHAGEFFSFGEIGVAPQPPRKRIPIW